MSIKVNAIYNEDCIKTMSNMEDNFIDLVVTSPPYDKLRSYNSNSNISIIWNKDVWKPIVKELFRVIKEGGVVVWVVGDSTIKGSETGTSFKQALHFMNIGFRLHDTMIYEKSGSPYPSTVRYYSSFEYMFVFSKGKPKTINLINDKKNKWGGTYTFGNSSNRQVNGTLKKTGKRLIKEFGIRTNIWRYVSGYGYGHVDKIAHKHPATFPEKLVKDHIISWSNINDIVYDPMAGSGTTLKMAKLHNRNFIGSEISREYCDLIIERLGM